MNGLDHERPRASWTRTLLLTALFAPLALLYVWGAGRQSVLVNLDMTRTDQSAYMNYAVRMHTTGYAHVGDRNRMPVYPFLLSQFHPDAIDEEFFTQGKIFNTWLSLVLLAGLWVLLRRRLPELAAINLTLITAFTVFIFKAAFVQADLLYYFLSFWTFLVMLDLLAAPGWKRSVLCGGLAGIAYLTKAAMLPGFMLFLFVGAIRFAVDAWKPRPRKEDGFRSPWSGPFAMGLVVVTFLAVVLPYISTSKRIFGRYFYNVNSTFYMWYDTNDEIMTGTRAHGDRVGWPDMPEEQIPSARKYFREHTLSQVVHRILDGLRESTRNAARAYGYFKYEVLYSVLALGALTWRTLLRIPMGRKTAAQGAFCVLYLGAYVTLFSWVAATSWGATRYSLQIFLPLMFSLASIHSASSTWIPSIRIRGRTLAPDTVFNAALLPVLAVDIFLVLNHRIMVIYGGS